MAKRKRNRYTSMAQINLTNLVDVSLVLLIIFILTAPVIKEGIEVNAPKAEAADPLSTSEDPIVVLITRERSIFVNNTLYTETTVGDSVRMKWEEHQRPVRLKADEALPYGYVIEILDKIRAAGVTQVSLVTKPVEKPGGET